jgi:DNA polymerase IV
MSRSDIRVIIHVDMDAFFTSVEQRDFPDYRGKPVIVGADPKGGKGRGVVAAASYEARRYGIHSAQPISQAYRRCPSAVFLRGRYERYAEVSESIMGVFREFTPLVEPVSLDEAFLDATGTERLFGSPERIGPAIKMRIREKERLTASVGIGPNKMVAKIASDLRKPDGLVIVSREKARDFLAPLPVSRLWGVGKKTEVFLLGLGIRTIGDLARYPEDALSGAFGKSGSLFRDYARGMDDDPVVPEQEAKSISNETTFETDQDDSDVIQKTILSLSEKVGYRLRREGLCARTVFMKVRIRDFSTQVKRSTLKEPFNLSEVVYRQAGALFRSCDLKGQKIRLLGVGVTQLSGAGENQADLFRTELEDKRQKAAQALDKLKAKFGNGVIGKREL